MKRRRRRRIAGGRVLSANDYAQVRLGDRLNVESRIVRLANTSFTFEQAIAFPDGRPAAHGTVTMACVGPERTASSVPLPDALKKVPDT